MRNGLDSTVKILVTAALGASLLGLVACKTETRPSGSSSVAAQPAAPGQPPQANGTGDSTGGNGINGKPFESYIQDVTTTAEWREWIAPIEAHLDSFASDEESKGALAKAARAQKWFFVPISLNQIPKNRLGVEFFQDPIQQLALQSRKEIWIDDTLYQKASSKDRALLVLHEISMFFYLLKFETFEEICRRAHQDCSHAGEAFDVPRFKPQDKRPLESFDYQNIRQVTAQLFDHYRELKSEKDYKLLLFSNHFDERLWGPGSYPRDPEQHLRLAEVEPKEIARWIRAQIRLGQVPRLLTRRYPRSDLESAKISLSEGNPTELVIEVGGETARFPIDFNPPGQPLPYGTLFTLNDAQPGPSISYTAPVKIPLPRFQVGQVFHSFTFHLGPHPIMKPSPDRPADLQQMRIRAIEIKPYEVVEVERVGEGEKVTYGIPEPGRRAAWIVTNEDTRSIFGVDAASGSTFTSTFDGAFFKPLPGGVETSPDPTP